jgi:uncharacterized protein YciW
MAMLAFLEKLNLTPEKISPKDIEPLKAAGLSATAIVDGLNVCFQHRLSPRQHARL